MNNNKDILMGFVYTNRTSQNKKIGKYLKELFLLKKVGEERIVYKIRIRTPLE
jgi:hypothetical protein